MTSHDDRDHAPGEPDEVSPEEINAEEISADEAAFRRIVAGYGAVPSIDDVASDVDRDGDVLDSPELDVAQEEPEPWDGEGEFTPPPLPPAPPTTWERLLAWCGLVIPVVVLLVAVSVSWSIPDLLGYGLIAWAIGGFAYLVRTMSQEPRDPGDDGARL